MAGFNLGTAAGQITVDGGGASAGFNVARSAANVFFDAVTSKVNQVERLGDRLTKVGATGVAGFGVAVKAASGFEAQMSAVEAVSGATGKEMDALSKKALQLGKDTSFSATEAGSAMEELVKAGLSVDDVLNGAADATVALAAAGGVSLPEAATIASNAMNQFELSAKDMPKVADLIAGAANASAIDVGDFGFSLSQAGAVANLTGLKFEDLAVAIAEMGNAGIKGSDAGTSIKTFLTNLIPTTDQQINKFQELGLYTVNTGNAMRELAEKGIKPANLEFDTILGTLEKYVAAQGGAKIGTNKNRKAALELGQQMGVLHNSFFKANGEAKSMRDIQEVLGKATNGLTKEQKLQTLEILFGSDAIRAAAVFAKEGAAGYDKMAASMGKVKAADVAKTRLDNLKGSVEQLKGSLETAQIIIGQVFLPIIRRIVDSISAAIDVFNNLPEGVQKAIAIFLGLGSVMTLATGLIIKLGFVLGPLLAHMLGLRAIQAVFGIFRTGFAVWRGGAGAAAALAASGSTAALIYTRVSRAVQAFIVWGRRFVVLSRAMGAAWAFITGPIGLIILAVIALGVILYKTFDPFKELVDGVARAIKEGFLASVEYVKEAWQAIVDGFTGVGDATSGFMGFMNQVGEAVRFVWDILVAMTGWFISNLMPVLKQAGETIMASLGEAWKTISKSVQEDLMPALTRMGETFTTVVLPALKELWGALQPLAPVFKIIGAVILGILVAPLLTLYGILIILIPIIVAVGSAFIEGFVNVVTAAVTAVIGYISGFIDVISGMIKVFVGLFTGDWGMMWEGIKQITSGAWKMITSIFTGAWGVIKGVVMGLVKGIIAFFTTLWDVLVGHSIVPDMITAIIRVFQSMPGALYNIIKTMVTNLIKFMLDMGVKMVNNVSNAISAVVKWFAGLPGRTMSAIGSLVGSMGRAANSWGKAVKDAVVNKFTDVVNWFKGLPAKIKSALGSLGNLLGQAGRNLIQGFINGIKNMFGSVKSTLGGLTDSLTSWKGPESLDKILLRQNGKLIIDGLIRGFDDKEPEVKAWLQALTKAIPDAGPGGYMESSDAAGYARVAAYERKQAAMDRQSSKTITTNIYNPSAEKASNSVAKKLRDMSSAGVI